MSAYRQAWGLSDSDRNTKRRGSDDLSDNADVGNEDEHDEVVTALRTTLRGINVKQAARAAAAVVADSGNDNHPAS